MSVAAVVVNWNAGASLESCLRSLKEQEGDVPILDLIVVDNASSDASFEGARAAVPGATFLANSVNVGFAGAVNSGIAHAPLSSDILLLNPDARLEPGSLSRLVAELRKYPDVGIVGPRLVDEDGQLQPECARSELRLETLIYELLGLRRFWPQRWRFGAYRFERWDHGGVRDVPCLSGACMLVRREVLDATGYLDETLPMYFEDMDLCARSRANGWRVRFVGDATVVHQGALCASISPHRMRLFVMEEGDARWLFFHRYRGRLQAWGASVIIGGGAAARYAVFATSARITTNPDRKRQLAHLKTKYGNLARWSVSRPKPIMRSIEG